MAKQNRKQPRKPRDKAGKPEPKREDKPRQGKRKLDIVEEAGKESFPASDPPSWTP